MNESHRRYTHADLEKLRIFYEMNLNILPDELRRHDVHIDLEKLRILYEMNLRIPPVLLPATKVRDEPYTIKELQKFLIPILK